MKIIGIIPARGGSKGVPRKNIKPLAGKPLIQYTIDAGLAVKELSGLIVSTEDNEIAELSQQLGAQVPFLRPNHLAQDSTPTIEVVLHILEWYSQKNIHFDAVCLLQPTSPLRTASLIREGIQVFQQHSYDSLISVLKVPEHFNPHWVFEKNNNGYLQIATGEEKIITRRQELPTAYFRSGDLYITSTQVLQSTHSFLGNRLGFVEVDPSRYLNIDTMEDWIKAEKLMEAYSV